MIIFHYTREGRINQFKIQNSYLIICLFSNSKKKEMGRIQRLWKRRALYVGHRNISISIFNFSPFLYSMKACQWNLILVMNITQTNFLSWQIVHIWRLIKVGLLTSKKKFFICFNDGPSKIMKNAFYFNLKAFFVLKVFKLLPWVL